MPQLNCMICIINLSFLPGLKYLVVKNVYIFMNDKYYFLCCLHNTHTIIFITKKQLLSSSCNSLITSNCHLTPVIVQTFVILKLLH